MFGYRHFNVSSPDSWIVVQEWGDPTLIILLEETEQWTYIDGVEYNELPARWARAVADLLRPIRRKIKIYLNK